MDDTIDPTQKFLKHFRMPKKEINKIKKQHQESKEASEKLDPEKLKDFEEITNSIFDFYEEISGRKTNRDIIKAHLIYWLDEGFNAEEIKNYIRTQKSEVWYSQNPEMFTIARLFPIKDEERIKIVWDLLAFELSKLESADFKKNILQLTIIRKECGHHQTAVAYRNDEVCMKCVEAKSEIACVIQPYGMFTFVQDDENLMQICWDFMRIANEPLRDYVIRTYPRRKELYDKHGIPIGSLDTVLFSVGEIADPTHSLLDSMKNK